MNVSRLLLAPALLSSAMPVLANDDPVDFFGLVNVTFQSTDDGDGRFTETKSNNSRVGVKGTYDLDDGLKAIYHLEWKVDVTDLSGGDNITGRNQYIGLQGGFGKVLIGRNDTMLKQAQGKIDQFNHLEMDIGKLWKGENRLSDTVTYVSPKLGDFSVGATYVAEESADGDSASSVSLMYGDKLLKKSKVFAAVGVDFDVKGYDTTRVSMQTKLDDLKIGAIFQRQEAVDTGVSKNGYLVSAAYAVDKLTYKAQIQTLEDDKVISVGADYSLGKNTKLFAFYADRNMENDPDSDWLAIGLEQKF
ncbi:porin [Neptunicella marina]|uniref:Porin n=1 Tax=Neptunicella marina TaxID=2125989 RepID=A0A8J6IS24_9ALTE|nr:porin [Neptunicella marina]MBC3764807.1 porin [Neptunicella marina]